MQAEADDLEALNVPRTVKLGGGAAMVAGIFALGLALQTALLFPLQGAMVWSSLFAATTLGLVAIASGWRMLRVGGVSAVIVTVSTGLLFALSSGWAVVVLTRGVFSLLAFGVPVLALLAAILAGVAIPPARKIGRAHDALTAQGLALRPNPLGPVLAHPRRVAAVAVGMTAAITLGVVWQRTHRPFDPTTTPYGELLGQKLTDYLIAKDSERAVRREALRSERARAVLGPEVTQALDVLLERAEGLEKTDPRETSRETAPPSVDAYLVAGSGLEDALRTSNLPVYVDVDFLRSRERLQPLLLSYYVEREASWDAGGTVVRTLHMWRMDHLRLSLPYLGYTRPRSSSALVLLDTIETDLVTGIVPALKPGEVFDLVGVNEERARTPWMDHLEQKAGDRARAELAAEASDPRFVRLAELLAKRRALVRKWATTLPQLGLVLRVPERYVPEAKYEDELVHRVPRQDLDEWRALHDELLHRSMLDAFVALRRRVVGSIERHEIQHRIDYAAGLLPVPPDLCSLLGVENPLGVSAASMPGRARDELSAYLAQIGTGGTPLLDLVLFSRALFRERVDAYTYAAWGALLSIGRELGIDVDAVIGRGRVRAEQFARALDVLLDKAPADIGAAAVRARKKAYGNELPELRLLNAVEHTTWRR